MTTDELLECLHEGFSLLTPVDGFLIDALEFVDAGREHFDALFNILWHFMSAFSQSVKGQNVGNSSNSLILGLLKLLLVVLLEFFGGLLDVSELLLKDLDFLFND